MLIGSFYYRSNMTTDITQTDYPVNVETGKPVTLAEVALLSWLPLSIDVHPWLGYPHPVSRHQSSAGSTLIPSTHPYITRVHRLVAWLQYIDEQLLYAAEDSVASQVGDLQVSFNRQMGSYMLMASNLLKELSRLIDVPIHYNKYVIMNDSTYCVRSPV